MIDLLVINKFVRFLRDRKNLGIIRSLFSERKSIHDSRHISNLLPMKKESTRPVDYSESSCLFKKIQNGMMLKDLGRECQYALGVQCLPDRGHAPMRRLVFRGARRAAACRVGSADGTEPRSCRTRT